MGEFLPHLEPVMSLGVAGLFTSWNFERSCQIVTLGPRSNFVRVP
jgi:hypothetical protein